MRDSNPPLKHGKNATSGTPKQFVDSVVDLDDLPTAELLTLWQTLNPNQRVDLLAVARGLAKCQHS